VAGLTSQLALRGFYFRTLEPRRIQQILDDPLELLPIYRPTFFSATCYHILSASRWLEKPLLAEIVPRAFRRFGRTAGSSTAPSPSLRSGDGFGRNDKAWGSWRERVKINVKGTGQEVSVPHGLASLR
jgi:hypothetical protein